MGQGHEKYGVDTSDGDAKKASAKPTHCPRCGERLAISANVLKCGTCGTLPFEDSNAPKR